MDPSLLSFGTATGTTGQFVLTYDASSDLTYLVWDRNGASPAGGVDLMAQFSGSVVLAAADILIL